MTVTVIKVTGLLVLVAMKNQRSDPGIVPRKLKTFYD